MIKLRKPVVLCGFMASGKSTIGKLAASKWQLPFYDTDAMIVSRAGQSIPEIFATGGEQKFRDLEHDICHEITNLGPCIISTGGGLLTFARNGDLLKGHSIIVLLRRDFEQTWQYLSKRQDRPMVRGKSKEDVLKLYNTRIPLYKTYANIEITNNDRPSLCVEHLELALSSRKW